MRRSALIEASAMQNEWRQGKASAMQSERRPRETFRQAREREHVSRDITLAEGKAALDTAPRNTLFCVSRRIHTPAACLPGEGSCLYMYKTTSNIFQRLVVHSFSLFTVRLTAGSSSHPIRTWNRVSASVSFLFQSLCTPFISS